MKVLFLMIEISNLVNTVFIYSWTELLFMVGLYTIIISGISSSTNISDGAMYLQFFGYLMTDGWKDLSGHQ